MPFPSCPSPLDMEDKLRPPQFGDVWPLLSPLPSWLPAPNSPRLSQFWSLLWPPLTGVTCNHSLFQWVEQGQTAEGLHVGQSSSHRIGKVGKKPPKSSSPSVNYHGGSLTVVTDNLVLVKLSSHVISKLQYFLLKIVTMFWNRLFLTNFCWLSLTVSHFIYIFCIISSPTLWFRHFREDIPAKKYVWSQSQKRLLKLVANKSKGRVTHSH